MRARVPDFQGLHTVANLQALQPGQRAPLSLFRPRETRPLTCRGFQKREFGLEWHRNKLDLLGSAPGPVLVGASYEFVPAEALHADNPSTRKVLKYSSFSSHEEYWGLLSELHKADTPQNFHEVFPAEKPRCLYFDLDGPAAFKSDHQQITRYLQMYVRWFFNGDSLGWEAGHPEPVVLRSANPKKYSCHVVFPQIQFRDYVQQQEYMSVLLSALGTLVVDAEGHDSLPILEKVVDKVPYSKFQLFRGPWACKLTDGVLRRDTRLEPEDYFNGDELTAFAGHVSTAHALELPPVEWLLAENEELRHFFEHHRHCISSSWCPSQLGGMRVPHPLDETNLYCQSFRRPGGGTIDFAGLTDLEAFEEALRWLHPERASQFWSWFRISGVTCRLLEQYHDCAASRQRIWNAHFLWSSSFPRFDAEENVRVVQKAELKHTSGLSLLLHLVQFDNPEMQVRTSLWHNQVRFGGRAACPAWSAPSTEVPSLDVSDDALTVGAAQARA